MTRNVTLRMEEELLRKLQHRAVDSGMSLSAWIAKVLGDLVPENEGLSQSRERALERLARGYHLGGRPVPRDELHAR